MNLNSSTPEAASSTSKSPWEMTRDELLAEERRLHEQDDAEYWHFSHSTSPKAGLAITVTARLAEVRAALGWIAFPWQMPYAAFNRRFSISVKAHRRSVEMAVADGKPVPAEVLEEYAREEYSREVNGGASK